MNIIANIVETETYPDNNRKLVKVQFEDADNGNEVIKTNRYLGSLDDEGEAKLAARIEKTRKIISGEKINITREDRRAS